jgi:hypothetical protein
VPDQNPLCPGNQPNVLLGVGHEPYRYPPVYGTQLGCPLFFDPDGNPVPPGSGTWIIQQGLIDTTGWMPQTYDFDVLPTSAAVFNPALDYSSEIFGPQLRITVPPDQMAGDAFSFTLHARADFDFDGDVDLNDFATFSNCFTGAGVTNRPPACQVSDFPATDLDDDGDVDLNDFNTFATNFTG